MFVRVLFSFKIYIDSWVSAEKNGATHQQGLHSWRLENKNKRWITIKYISVCHSRSIARCDFSISILRREKPKKKKKTKQKGIDYDNWPSAYYNTESSFIPFFVCLFFFTHLTWCVENSNKHLKERNKRAHRNDRFIEMISRSSSLYKHNTEREREQIILEKKKCRRMRSSI